MNVAIYYPLWKLICLVVLSMLAGGFLWDTFLRIDAELTIRKIHKKLQEMAEDEHDSCEGCKWHLGGGCCSLNVDDECAAGGGYELWEGEEDG